MELTDQEKLLIQSMRLGADIEIWRFDVDDLDEMIRWVQEFGEITNVNYYNDRVVVSHKGENISVYGSYDT